MTISLGAPCNAVRVFDLNAQHAFSLPFAPTCSILQHYVKVLARWAKCKSEPIAYPALLRLNVCTRSVDGNFPRPVRSFVLPCQTAPRYPSVRLLSIHRHSPEKLRLRVSKTQLSTHTIQADNCVVLFFSSTARPCACARAPPLPPIPPTLDGNPALRKNGSF